MKITLIGTVFNRSTDEPAIKLSYTGEGKAIAKFTVSEPRKFGRTDGNKLDFWDVTVFGKQAEFVEKNFGAGKPIFIMGDAYHSKDDKGKTHMNVVANDLDFVPKEFVGNTGGTAPAPTQQPAQQVQAQPAQNPAPQSQPQAQPVQQTQQVAQPAQQAPVQQTVQQAQPQVAQPVQQAPQQVAQPQPAPAANAAPNFAPPEGFDPFG